MNLHNPLFTVGPLVLLFLLRRIGDGGARREGWASLGSIVVMAAVVIPSQRFLLDRVDETLHPNLIRATIAIYWALFIGLIAFALHQALNPRAPAAPLPATPLTPDVLRRPPELEPAAFRPSPEQDGDAG